MNRILIHCQGDYPIISLLAASFFSKGHLHVDGYLVITNTKGRCDYGQVGKKAGQVWYQAE